MSQIANGVVELGDVVVVGGDDNDLFSVLDDLSVTRSELTQPAVVVVNLRFAGQLKRMERRGGMVSLSPSQTPRSSDKVARDLRSAEGNASIKFDRDKGVNVQVIVRCR
ncbi:hypothetical protein RHGRI_036451 [Rhododendron griersonianum]|uniref:Uncharacterized protein n=1 Tax=Rhododendron griersonianum TaxID=479676 RepID=A0AAV6HN01_9ERIC|nr:hypothetical protein RHGRI_036451 [Rhododendron griersonianum]